MGAARDAAELVVLLREEEASESDEIMAAVRRDYPEVSMSAVFREVTAIEQARRGNA